MVIYFFLPFLRFHRVALKQGSWIHDILSVAQYMYIPLTIFFFFFTLLNQLFFHLIFIYISLLNNFDREYLVFFDKAYFGQINFGLKLPTNIYISKNWSITFIIDMLLLSHIKSHIIHLFLTFSPIFFFNSSFFFY